MRKSGFTAEQITIALRQAEADTAVAEICRKLEVTETTLYRWKKKYGGLGIAELRELRQLREENRKLKDVVADLTLDKAIFQESCEKNGTAGPATHRGCLGGFRLPDQRTARMSCHRRDAISSSLSERAAAER